MTSYRVLVSNDSHAWTAVRNESGDVVSRMKHVLWGGAEVGKQGLATG